MSDTHHGLVDESSALELDDAKGVSRVGPGVLDQIPFIPRGVDLHQLVSFFDRVGARRDGHVLRGQLTTGTSRQSTGEVVDVLALVWTPTLNLLYCVDSSF